jgi:hypothetical protein
MKLTKICKTVSGDFTQVDGLVESFWGMAEKIREILIYTFNLEEREFFLSGRKIANMLTNYIVKLKK